MAPSPHSLTSSIPKLVFALVALACSTALEAATVTGKVYDMSTNVYVESATVTAIGTEQSVYTERGGEFRITGLEPGTYTIQATAIGYPASQETVVIVDDDDRVTMNVALGQEEAAFELEAFTVEAHVIGQAKGEALRRSADELREVVSADNFGQFADRNPAEALQRVAGITVEDNQGEGEFLIIRGASPDLSIVQIDGVSLATPQEDGRRVNLNVITVDQLERIEVSKTWLPSQKGGVIGGTVNMITRSALDRGKMFASLEGAYTARDIADDDSYRAALTVGDVIDERDFSWLGDMAIGLQFSVNHSLDYSGSDTVNYTWSHEVPYPYLPNTVDGEFVRGYSPRETRARDFDVERERLGLSGRIEFKLNDRHDFYFSISHNEFDDDETIQTFRVRPMMTDRFFGAGSLKLTQGIVDQLGLDVNDPYVRSRLTSSAPATSYLTYAEAEALGELSYDESTKQFAYSLWRADLYRDFSHQLTNDEISTFQYGGNHEFSDSFSGDWKVYQSNAEQQSDLRSYGFHLNDDVAVSAGSDVEYPYNTSIGGSERIFAPEFYYILSDHDGGDGPNREQHLSIDERSGFEGNLQHDFELGGLTFTTKLGGFADLRDKSFEIDSNSYTLFLDEGVYPEHRLSLAHDVFNGGEITDFQDNFGKNFRFGAAFDPESTKSFFRNPGDYGASLTQNSSNLTQDFADRLTTNYEAGEDISGAFLQQHVNWGQWTILFGARYEHTDNEFTNLEIITRSDKLINPQTGEPRFISPPLWRLVDEQIGDSTIYSTLITTTRSYDHLLPALHVRRKIGENIEVRAAVTKTIARPLFTDLIPREVPGISSNEFTKSIQLPAMDLMPMESINYDLSFDYYFEPVGHLTVAAFYKDLDGPIYEEVRRGVGPNDETAYFESKYTAQGLNNSSYTFSRMRNSGKGNLYGAELTFNRTLDDFLPGMLQGFGVESNLAFFESEATLLSFERYGETVPLFRQPSMTANASLYYNKHGIFARLSYNRRGHYLQAAAAGETVLEIEELFGDGTDAWDVYVDDSERWDFTLRYNITPSWQVFAEAINITNEPLSRYRGDRSRLDQVQFTETTYTVGFRWSL